MMMTMISLSLFSSGVSYLGVHITLEVHMDVRCRFIKEDVFFFVFFGYHRKEKMLGVLVGYGYGCAWIGLFLLTGGGIF